MNDFNPKDFVDKQTKEIKKAVGGERAIIAVSGGVDSTACAVLTHTALGKNLLCVILDTAFMREGEPETVAHILSQPPLNFNVWTEPMAIFSSCRRLLRLPQLLRHANLLCRSKTKRYHCFCST